MVGAYCQGTASFVWSVNQIPTGVVISGPSTLWSDLSWPSSPVARKRHGAAAVDGGC